MISPASYSDSRKDIINATISDIRETVPAIHVEALDNFDYNSLFRLIETIDLQVGTEMMLFVKNKKPIAIPYIGNISVNKIRLRYIEAEKDLLIEYGVDRYEQLDTKEKVEFDEELKKRARLLKIQSSKRFKRQMAQDILNNTINNVVK